VDRGRNGRSATIRRLGKLLTMRKILVTALTIFAFFSPKPAFAQEVIDKATNFYSEITINQDASISIKETIDYETNLQKHGIYRYIPLRYQINTLCSPQAQHNIGCLLGFSYTAKIKDIKATDELGKAIAYTSFKQSGNQVIKIGDPDKTFTGEKIYIISYTTENALKRFENLDALYWDITGEGWQIPIEKSSAKIISPHAEITKVDCFTGPVGGNDGLCEKSFTKETAIFSYPETIGYGKNFTVAVALNQDNQIIFPTKTELFIKWVRDNFFLFLIPLPLFIIFAFWFKKGRDFIFTSPNVFNLDKDRPKKLKPLFYKHRTPFVYEPLKDLTPGEAGAILDERVDNQDIVAEILDLARKKYLKIEAIGEKSLFKTQDFKFIKLKNPDNELPEHQKYLLKSIFGRYKERLLSKLKGKFHTKMQKAKQMIGNSAADKKLFTRDTRKDRILYMVLFAFLSILGFFPMIFAIGATDSVLPLLIFLVCDIFGFILAYNMPQKTAIGTNLMLQAKGLRKTIRLGRWREEIKEKHLFIEEIFPFAVSLGVVTKLARDMEKLNLKPPSYFPGYAAYHKSFGSFAKTFNSQVSSGLSLNPSSGKWSGGSGFSGGGSSGGGGGGGGGSW